MRFLFISLQKLESEFYGRVAGELIRRGHEASHVTFSRRAAMLLRRRGVDAHVLPARMADLGPLEPQHEAARIVQRYDTPTLRDVYRTDHICDGRPEGWCVERTARHFVAMEHLFDEIRPDVVVPEVGNETIRTAAHLIGLDRRIPVLMLGYTIFPRSLMLCVDTLDQPIVAREEVRELSGSERVEVDAFVRAFTRAGKPIRPYRSRPIHAGRARTLLRHLAVRALWDRDNDYLEPVRWSVALAAERIRPRLARALYEPLEAGRPFVYFPLHLGEDYKLKRLIPHCADQEWVIRQVAGALPHGYDLVVKEHPIAVGRYGLRLLARLRRIPGVRLVEPYTSSHELICAASAVAVVSSTVGLEALLHDKPVLTLGRPYYAGYGITVDLESFRDVRRLVPAALDFRPDAEEVRRFLHAGMRRCFAGAPVLVDDSDENARDVAASLEEAVADPGGPRVPDWRGSAEPGPKLGAMKAQEFEQAVLAQEPVSAEHYSEEYFSADWREGGNRYELETRRRIEARNPQLIREVFEPDRVLDVGCGPGFLMHFLHELGVEVDGIDFSPQSPALAPESVRDRITVGPVDEPLVAERSYDLVICREVMEHLTVLQVRRTVAQICRASSRYAYVTTRFHPEPSGLLDFTTQFEVDPTHITLLTKDFLRCLFVLEGFRRRADLEERMDWGKKGRVLVYERDE